MKNVIESRRNAIKKLGITSGAAWVAPAVTALVVPKHASATSVSASGSSDFSSILSVSTISPPGVTTNVALVLSSATDYSGLTASLSIGGAPATLDAVSFTPAGPMSMTQWEFTASSVTVGDTYSAVVDGRTYTGTVTA
jgi:hypothetical protein